MSEIKAIRDSLGLTQAQLAAQLGVTQSRVSRFETGEITPDRRTILAVQALRASGGSTPLAAGPVPSPEPCGPS